MKKLFLASTAIVALAVGSAGAADMARPVLKAPPPPPPLCAQFGGFYVGGQIGAIYYDHNWNDLDNFGNRGAPSTGSSGPGGSAQSIDENPDEPPKPDPNPNPTPAGAAGLPTSTSTSKAGWNGGVLAGFNWQPSRCTIFGFEADWNWTNTKADDFHAFESTGASVNIASRMQWFGTFRARSGLVVDNLLLYVTGGVAWARFNRDFDFAIPELESFFSGTNTRWGWTAGVGTEWWLTPSISLKGEVLYLAFSNRENSFTVDSSNFRFASNDSAWVSRIGLNFRFGGIGKAPIGTY